MSDIVGQSTTAEVDVFVKPPAVSELRGMHHTNCQIYIQRKELTGSCRSNQYCSWCRTGFEYHSAFKLGHTRWNEESGCCSLQKTIVEAAWVRTWYTNSFKIEKAELLEPNHCRGPNEAAFVGDQLGLVNATGLTKGKYIFQLTAWDSAETKNNDTVTVIVQQSMLSRISSLDWRYQLSPFDCC